MGAHWACVCVKPMCTSVCHMTVWRVCVSCSSWCCIAFVMVWMPNCWVNRRSCDDEASIPKCVVGFADGRQPAGWLCAPDGGRCGDDRRGGDRPQYGRL